MELPSSFFSYKCLKLKFKGVLTGYTVAMVTSDVNKNNHNLFANDREFV